MFTSHAYDLTFVSGSGEDGDEASDRSSRLCCNICECDTTGYFWDLRIISKQVFDSLHLWKNMQMYNL